MQRLSKSAVVLLVLILSIAVTGCGEPSPEEMLSESLEHLAAAKSGTSAGTVTITVSINKQRIAELMEEGYIDSESAAAFAFMPAELVFYLDIDASYNEDSYYLSGNLRMADDLADTLALFGIPAQIDFGYYMSQSHGIYFKSQALAELLVMLEDPSYYGEEPLYPDFSVWQQVGDASETAELFAGQQLTGSTAFAAELIEALTVIDSRKGREGVYDIDVTIDMDKLEQAFLEQLEAGQSLTQQEKAEFEEILTVVRDLFIYEFTYTVAEENDQHVVQALKGSMTLNPNATIWSSPEVQESGLSGDIFGLEAEFELDYANLGADVNTVPGDLDLNK